MWWQDKMSVFELTKSAALSVSVSLKFLDDEVG